MKKHLFFDLDGTLTESRQPISFLMSERLSEINSDIIVISGAERERIMKQLGGFVPDYVMAQCGSDCPYWKKKISEQEEREVLNHLFQIKKRYPHFDWDNKDLYQNRGSQISFSFIGHNADMERKRSFDGDGKIRSEILEAIPFKGNSMKCKIAGATCFDYNHKEYTKGKNIERLLKHLEWDKEDCIYYGDKLSKGGNDETVIGVIETVEIKNPQHLLEIIKDYE